MSSDVCSRLFTREKTDERVRGIEPPCAAWEAAVLPLNYTRGEILDFRFSIPDCNRNKLVHAKPLPAARPLESITARKLRRRLRYLNSCRLSHLLDRCRATMRLHQAADSALLLR